MEIWANSQKVPFQIEKEETLGDLVSSLLILSNQANKVVLEVKVDEQILPLEEREKFEAKPIAEVKKVEIIVEEKLKIALIALDEAKRLLPEFTKNLAEVTELLMAGQKHKAMSVFGQSLLIWRKIINFFRTVGVSYQIDFNTLTFDSQTIEEKNLELLKVLQEIKQAMEREDIVTLSDLIEYELIDKVNRQSIIIDELVVVAKQRDKEVQDDIKASLSAANAVHA